MTIVAASPKPLASADAGAAPAPARAGRLFRKYVALFVILIGGILIASGLVEMWFSYQENKQALAAVQREKAAAGAQRIEQFIDELRRQIGWTTRSAWSAAVIEQRQIDYFRLLRQAPSITEISHLDADGREDIKVSRVGMNTIGSRTDYSADPRFVEAKKHKVWFSPVYFLRDTEPYMTLAMAGSGRDSGVTVAEINLKFIWDPITRIRAGKAGYAYVVDGSGHLIAHPDLGLVLRKTDLSRLPQVAGLRRPDGKGPGDLIGQGIGGGEVVTAHATIPLLGWTLFVDLPIAEAFVPVYDSLLRSGLLILFGLVLAVGASLLLTRRIVGPIQALTAGAARIGSGDLAHRIDVRTKDELQDLAVRFNTMAEGLQESYGRLEQRVEERTHELSEALEYQTATGDVLKVISRSAFDLDTVLSTLVETAMRLCNAGEASMFRREGDALVRVVSRRVEPGLEPVPLRRAIDRRSGIGRAAVDKRAIHLPDILEDPDVDDVIKGEMRKLGIRTALAVPLLRENELIGVLGLTRPTVSAFSQREIDLITVFADQAVIAIENARLVQEIRESLEYQTATGDVLKVISRSAFDLDTVLTTLIETAMRLCNAGGAAMFRLEGDALVTVVSRRSEPSLEQVRIGRTLDRGSSIGRAAIDKRVVHLPNILEDPDVDEAVKDDMRMLGIRTVLAVPLLRERELIGVIGLNRSNVSAFAQREIDLVTVFADQAVIAIENARLVQEIRESLEYQTATSDVLKVISRSAFELDTVLTTLVETAARLCNADRARIFRREGDAFRSAAATSGYEPQWSAALDKLDLVMDRHSIVGRVAIEERVVHLLDSWDDPEARPEFAASRRAGNTRTILGVPLMREGKLIGVIVLTRSRVEAFSEREIELVTTFADQAVIAIENARLLQEIRAHTAALAQSVDELRALGESGRSVVATLDLGQVLDTIMDGAVELGRADAGAIFRYTRAVREFSLWRAHGLPDDYAAELQAMRIPAAQTAMGTALLEDRTRELDIEESPLLPLREATMAAGFRHVLVVPLIRGKRGYGAMVLYYRDGAHVPERAHDLMQTFASQSVVAIQNARLFREIAEKSRELEIASQHKSQFLANMSHELRTPMNAILGYTELMLDGLFGDLNADMKDTLDRVQQNGKHLLSLINDVLDLSKIEAGRLELTFADYDAHTVVQAVMAAARPLAESKGIAIASEVAPDVPLGWGDERRLTQVLLNFASNAVKFTDKGSVLIAARGRDGAIEFAVTDTGPGIDPKDQARIFEEFQQADNSITREKGGTGLGLSISKRIVELHGGTISVESQPGRGATFRALVPIRADAEEAAA